MVLQFYFKSSQPTVRSHIHLVTLTYLAMENDTKFFAFFQYPYCKRLNTKICRYLLLKYVLWEYCNIDRIEQKEIVCVCQFQFNIRSQHALVELLVHKNI